MATEKCRESNSSLLYAEVKLWTSRAGAKTYDVPKKCVFTQQVSIHAPIQRFITDMIVCFDNCLGLTNRALERLETHWPLIEIVDPVLTALTVLAQTKVGMWRRNGAPCEGQYFIYHHPRLGMYPKTNDLTLLQACASLMEDPGLLVASMLERFQLVSWANESLDEKNLKDEVIEQVHMLADEFFLIIVGILLERNHRHVAEVSHEEELRHQVLHQLCTGELSHSEVIQNCHLDEGKHEVMVENILHTIAERKTCKKDTSRKVYHLKSDYMTEFNPYHYFYTR